MLIKKIRLFNFRNYRDVVIPFSPRINVFIGENGQGKTNILEALYLISQGETFRYGNNSTIISHEKSESIIQSIITENNLDYKVQLSLLEKKRSFLLNSKKINAEGIKKIFSAVIFSPESLSAIKEGSDQRRNLIDEFLVTYDRNNSELISAYRRVLKTRNKILKNYQSGLENKKNTEDLLNSIYPSFLTLSTELTFQRILALRGIFKDFNNAMKYISKKEDVDISVEYLVSGRNCLNSNKEEIAFFLENRIKDLINAEISSGTSLVGPHKHDISFLYNQNDSRFFCSQGQQRAIILSFKIAQIVYHRKAYGTYPVLMLDDVLSELDKIKRDALISFLHEINTQIFITTTDFSIPEFFSLDQLSVVHIKDGNILD